MDVTEAVCRLIEVLVNAAFNALPDLLVGLFDL